jgi:hypothetical protein
MSGGLVRALLLVCNVDTRDKRDSAKGIGVIYSRVEIRLMYNPFDDRAQHSSRIIVVSD